MGRSCVNMNIVGMRRVFGLFVVFGLLLIHAAVPTPSSAQSPEPLTGGRVVVAAEQEPAGGLQHWLICCQMQWTEWLVDSLLPDAYRQTPDFTWVPEVLAEEAEIGLDPFTITYRIREEATWNDGVPVSARDLVFTWRSHTDNENSVASREGYRLIRDARVTDDKTVAFTFRRPYPDYRLLFQDVLPHHVLKDKNLNRAWRRQIPISAGPFEFKEYELGSHLTLARNDDYWGEHLAYLDEIEYRFIPDPRDAMSALSAGEVDVIYPYFVIHPDQAEVRGWEDIAVQSSPGLLWEHIDMSFRDPRLRRPFIRRAIATAIGREEIVEQIIRPIDPDAQVTQNLLFAQGEPGYEPHFDGYVRDVDAARQILGDHGCETDADGIYACDGQTLKFTYYTTRLNPVRRLVAEAVRDQLIDAGIELEVRRRDPAIVFGPRILVGANYDLFQYAWVHTELANDREIWSCNGSQNFTQYCNPDVGALLQEAARELDSDRALRLANMADAVMARDLVSIPLYQRPTFLAYRAQVQGLIDNPTAEGFTWNIGDWWLQN